MPLLLMKEVSKIYPGTIALDKASIKLEKGQVLGMLGLNGAGKSTLMKILSGDITADEGEIYIEDSPITIKNPKDAIEQGIATVYQESQLVEQMTVYENVLLGRECLLHGGVDFSTMQKLVKDEIEKFGFQIPVKAKVSELSKRLIILIRLQCCQCCLFRRSAQQESGSFLSTLEERGIYQTWGAEWLICCAVSE